MDLEKYKELSELNEKIYDLRLKNARFEVQQKVFEQVGAAGDGLGRLNFVHDFVLLISQNLKKMSALTLTLMNQSEETSSSNNVFKLRKELKSVLLEYLQRIVKFTLQDGKENGGTERETLPLDSKFGSDEIAPIYDFILKKLESDVIKDGKERGILTEIASDFHKIIGQLEKFNKMFH